MNMTPLSLLQSAYDYDAHIICVDLEATCCNDNSFPRHEMEIIEIGIAVFKPSDPAVLQTWYSFVQPTIHKTLTPFCTQLTTITQSQVNSAETWSTVACRVRSFMGSLESGPVIWTSWGDFDKNKIEKECTAKNVANPFADIEHINLKQIDADITGANPRGLGRALKDRKLNFPGQAHRAINDAMAVSMVVAHMRENQ